LKTKDILRHSLTISSQVHAESSMNFSIQIIDFVRGIKSPFFYLWNGIRGLHDTSQGIRAPGGTRLLRLHGKCAVDNDLTHRSDRFEWSERHRAA